MERLEKALEKNSQTYANEEFWDLCSKSDQSRNIKKLFLRLEYREKLNSEILTNGLLGALDGNQVSYIPIILGFMEKNNITPDAHEVVNSLFSEAKNKNLIKDEIVNLLEISNVEKHFDKLQLLLNYAINEKNINLVRNIEQKFSVIEKSMTEDMGERISLVAGPSSSFAKLKSDGSLSFSGAFGNEWTTLELMKSDFNMNPFLFSLQCLGFKRLDHFLGKDCEVSPSLITHAIVKSIASGSKEAIFYLFGNEKCLNIIKNSAEIKAFINSDVDYPEEKKEARILLSKLELYDKLSNSIETKSANNTVKI